jgi:hypothetical protein
VYQDRAPSSIHPFRLLRTLSHPYQPALDLSSVRHMINAAEPVDGPSLDAFTAAFRPLGLRCAPSPADDPSSSSIISNDGEEGSGVVFPTYGLAEHTVFVCGGGECFERSTLGVALCYVCLEPTTCIGDASSLSFNFKQAGSASGWTRRRWRVRDRERRRSHRALQGPGRS